MNAPLPHLGALLALGSALCWAFAVILFKRSGETVHPISLNLFKNSLAFLLFPPTLLIFGLPLLVPTPRHDLFLLLLSGFLGMGISDTFHLAGLNKLGAGLFSIVTTLYVPMVIFLSMAVLGEHLGPLQWGGVVLILTAVLMVTERTGVSTHASRERRTLAIGIGYLLLGMSAMAVSVVLIKPVLDRTPLIWATEMRLGGGLVFLLPLALLRRDRKRLFAGLFDRTGMRYMLPGSLFGAYFALLMLLGSIKLALASTATALNQLANLFIFILAVLFLREPLNPVRIAGILLGVLGAVLVTFG